MKVFKDVTKKPGYEPYRKDHEWKKDLVGIRVIFNQEDGEPPVAPCGLNGEHYYIPRGENVRVPRLIKDVLESRTQHTWDIGGRAQMTGMRYIGKAPRYYVIELNENDTAKAPILGGVSTLAADKRIVLEQQAIIAAQEDAMAMAEMRNNRVVE